MRMLCRVRSFPASVSTQPCVVCCRKPSIWMVVRPPPSCAPMAVGKWSCAVTSSATSPTTRRCTSWRQPVPSRAWSPTSLSGLTVWRLRSTRCWPFSPRFGDSKKTSEPWLLRRRSSSRCLRRHIHTCALNVANPARLSATRHASSAVVNWCAAGAMGLAAATTAAVVTRCATMCHILMRPLLIARSVMSFLRALTRLGKCGQPSGRKRLLSVCPAKSPASALTASTQCSKSIPGFQATPHPTSRDPASIREAAPPATSKPWMYATRVFCVLAIVLMSR